MNSPKVCLLIKAVLPTPDAPIIAILIFISLKIENSILEKMESIPPRLLTYLFTFLDNNSLFNITLVNKKFKKCSVPLIFEIKKKLYIERGVSYRFTDKNMESIPPRLLTYLFTFLDNNSLFNITLVNKKFKKCSVPLIYKVDENKCEKELNYKFIGIKIEFLREYKYSDLVSLIHIVGDVTLEDLLYLYNNIENLKFLIVSGDIDLGYYYMYCSGQITFNIKCNILRVDNASYGIDKLICNEIIRNDNIHLQIGNLILKYDPKSIYKNFNHVNVYYDLTLIGFPDQINITLCRCDGEKNFINCSDKFGENNITISNGCQCNIIEDYAADEDDY